MSGNTEHNNQPDKQPATEFPRVVKLTLKAPLELTLYRAPSPIDGCPEVVALSAGDAIWLIQGPVTALGFVNAHVHVGDSSDDGLVPIPTFEELVKGGYEVPTTTCDGRPLPS